MQVGLCEQSVASYWWDRWQVVSSQSVVVSNCDIDVRRYDNFNKERVLEAVYKYCE